MDEQTKNYFYNCFFRLEMYKRSGEEFQIFFSDIMRQINPEFVKVAAFGGDGGNDGCIPSEGCYYQVYAPKPTTSSSYSDSSALKKSLKDFKKLKEHWDNTGILPNISKYHFVYNDRFTGIPTEIIRALSDIQSFYNLTESGCICSNKIEDFFEEFPEGKKLRLLGRAPMTEAPFEINPSALGGLLQHLAHQNSNSLGLLTNESAPAWQKKIQINGINDLLAQRIKTYNTQRFRINDYLQSSGLIDSQGIAEQVREVYSTSKKYIPDTTKDHATVRYFWMVDMLIPPEILHSESQIIIQAYRNVAEIVLSYYFETCDVYEDPN